MSNGSYHAFMIARRNVIEINNMTSNMSSLEVAMSLELN